MSKALHQNCLFDTFLILDTHSAAGRQPQLRDASQIRATIRVSVQRHKAYSSRDTFAEKGMPREQGIAQHSSFNTFVIWETYSYGGHQPQLQDAIQCRVRLGFRVQRSTNPTDSVILGMKKACQGEHSTAQT